MTNLSTPNPLVILAETLPPGGVFLSLPAEAIHDSRFQYRKTYNEAKLEELAVSIRETGGIHQPMLARRRFPNSLRTDYEPENGVELVSGHRRKISGMRALLPFFPVLVKDLTDDQVRRIQITENLQREDVHPIEEAEGFQALIDAGDNADQLAVQFGKSRSYVYGRLKLLQACPEIRNACLEGKIGSEVALLIARLRTPKLQEKALSYIKGRYINLEDGGAISYRSIRSLMAEHFTLDLKKPMFDPTDALLLPGAGACGDCPKRTGNAPEFADFLGEERINYGIHGADVCTDPDCYAAKKSAHLRNAAAVLESKGKTVIDGARARVAVSATGEVKGAYVALKDVKKELAEARTAAQRDSKIVPPLVVTIQDPRTGKTFEAVKRAELVAAGASTIKEPKDDLEAQRKAREAQHERDQVKVKCEQSARLGVLKALREKIQTTERSAFDMTLIAHATYQGVGWEERPLLAELWDRDPDCEMDDEIDTMTPSEHMLFMFDCALVGECQVGYLHEIKNAPENLLKVAAFYGIDVAAARGEAPAKPASTPSTAARAAKETKGHANNKKRPSVSLGALMRASSAGAGVDLVGDAIGSNQSVEAGSAGDEAKDESANADVERDPNTSDMFEGTSA